MFTKYYYYVYDSIDNERQWIGHANLKKIFNIKYENVTNYSF